MQSALVKGEKRRDEKGKPVKVKEHTSVLPCIALFQNVYNIVFGGKVFEWFLIIIDALTPMPLTYTSKGVFHRIPQF